MKNLHKILNIFLSLSLAHSFSSFSYKEMGDHLGPYSSLKIRSSALLYESSEEYVLYRQAAIEDGKRKGGERVDAFSNATVLSRKIKIFGAEDIPLVVERYKLHPKGVLSLLRLNKIWRRYSQGTVSVEAVDPELKNDKRLFASEKQGRLKFQEGVNEASLTEWGYPASVLELYQRSQRVYVTVKVGWDEETGKPQVKSVYDEVGREFYSLLAAETKEEEFILYRQAAIEDGKRKGGERVDAFSNSTALSRKIKIFGAEDIPLVVERLKLQRHGSIDFLGLTRNGGRYSQGTVSVEAVEAVDPELMKDERLFASEKQGRLKFKKGVNEASLTEWEYPASVFKLYQRSQRVYVTVKVGWDEETGKPQVKSIYDEVGREIYSLPAAETKEEKFILYRQAAIEDGKRKGGERVDAFSTASVLSRKIKKLGADDIPLVVERYKLHPIRGIYFLGLHKRWSRYSQGTVSVEAVEEVNPKLKEDERLFASEKQGRLKFKKGVNEASLTEWEYPASVFKLYQRSQRVYVTVKVGWDEETGKPQGKSVYDEVGREIYSLPAAETKEEKFILYRQAAIEDGKRKGGERVDAFSTAKVLSEEIKKLGADDIPLVVERYKVQRKGGIYFLGLTRTWGRYSQGTVSVKAVEEVDPELMKDERLFAWEKQGRLKFKKGVNEASLTEWGYSAPVFKLYQRSQRVYVTVKVGWDEETGKPQVKSIYDEVGGEFYRRLSSLNVESILLEEELEKLIDLFGVVSAARVLKRFYGVGIAEAARVVSNYKFKNPPSGRGTGTGTGNKNLGFSTFLKRFKELDIFERGTNEHIDFITSELVRLIYPYLVNNYKFLSLLEEESRKEENGEFLQECFRRVVSHYRSFEGLHFKGLKRGVWLKFYQKIGIKFILNFKKVILADEPGLGKTLQALVAAMNAYGGRGAKKILIVAPNIAKYSVWEEQIQQYLRGEQKTSIINARKDLDKAKKKREVEEARFVIVNYELLRGDNAKAVAFRNQLKELGFDFIIFDEVHRIRNDDTLTHKAVSEFSAKFEVGISGTPLRGRSVAKLFPLIDKLQPQLFESREEFVRLMLENPVLVQQRLETILLRRYAQDVLPELPPLEVEIRKVSMGEEQAEVYRLLEKPLFEKTSVHPFDDLRLLRLATLDVSFFPMIHFSNVKGGEVISLPQGARVVALEGVSFDILYNRNSEKGEHLRLRARNLSKGSEKKKLIIKNGETIQIGKKEYRLQLEHREVPSAKYAALDDIVDQVYLTERKKLAVFTGSVPVAKKLKIRYDRKGYRVFLIHGEITKSRRHRILKEVKHSAEPVIFIATSNTMGEAVNLQEISRGVLLDLPWTSQKRDQILRRLHRLGQQELTRFSILQLKRTVDQHVEVVVAECEILEKLFFDDPSIKIDPKKNILTRLQTIKAKVEEKQETVNENGEGASLSFFDELREGSYFVLFKEGVLRTRLETNSGGFIETKGIIQLLEKGAYLAPSAKKLLREFFLRRFEEEEAHGLRVKDRILWTIATHVIPGFDLIDYDGKLEMLVELSGLIFGRIINDSSVGLEAIKDQIRGFPDGTFEETMAFLDESNLLKLFSTIGVLDSRYYVQGALLQYHRPITLYYDSVGIYYYDSEVVGSIVPGWNEGERRPLSRDEEIRLARQLEWGNRAAQEALVNTYLERVPSMARSVKRVVEIRLKLSFGKETLQDFQQQGTVLLHEAVRDYAANGTSERLTLEEYLNENLIRQLFRYGFQIGGQLLKERAFSMGDPGEEVGMDYFASGSSESLSSLEAQAREEESQMRQLFSRLLSRMGFSSGEKRVLVMHVFDGLDARKIAEGFNLALLQVTSVIERYKREVSQFDPQEAYVLFHSEGSRELESPAPNDDPFSALDRDGRSQGLFDIAA